MCPRYCTPCPLCTRSLHPLCTPHSHYATYALPTPHPLLYARPSPRTRPQCMVHPPRFPATGPEATGCAGVVFQGLRQIPHGGRVRGGKPHAGKHGCQQPAGGECMHIHAYAHAHMNTCKHANMHTCTHTHIHTYTHKLTLFRTHRPLYNRINLHRLPIKNPHPGGFRGHQGPAEGEARQRGAEGTGATVGRLCGEERH